MLIRFSSTKLQKSCSTQANRKRAYGSQIANTLRLRLAELQYAENMNDLLQGTGKWERLTGNFAGHWSARLSGNWRLIVRPENTTRQIEVVVEVVDIQDYH
ncbi:type II toxin-antitoxin system RelE/ParE family toxin [Varibaculum vaginae]|uniref:type II toxin-antitoxin system RelE/ParE family toxin n=1 Tax=Varibaculum vaginae TaxID=2364797 RepID=UPI000F089295|nr:type II toxin-antitoxin system RelE/ParE family toxin [Varibaculum vaginae]